jgi:hypothetical protein
MLNNISHFLKLLLVLSISFCVSGCSNLKEKELVKLSSNFETIIIDTNVVSLKVSEISKSITYVPLETKETNLIGKIDKIQYFEGVIFILDKRISKSIFLFDKEGKFLYQKKAGTGDMKRITSIADFAIDNNNKIIYIYADDEKTVLAYSIKDGTFIKNFKINSYFSRLQIINSNAFLFLRDGLDQYKDDYGEARICLIDSTGELINRWIDNPINPFLSGGEIICNENSSGNAILISRMFKDTIYSFPVSKMTIEARYKVDIGRSMVTSDFFQTKDPEFFKKQFEDSSTSYISGHLFDTKKIFSFFIKRGNSICLFWQNKLSKQQYMIKNFINDYDYSVLPLMSYMNDSIFLSVIPPSMLHQQYSLNSGLQNFTNKYSMLIKLTKSLTPDSNPIICFVELK